MTQSVTDADSCFSSSVKSETSADVCLNTWLMGFAFPSLGMTEREHGLRRWLWCRLAAGGYRGLGTLNSGLRSAVEFGDFTLQLGGLPLQCLYFQLNLTRLLPSRHLDKARPFLVQPVQFVGRVFA